jgi:hypothetical protein
MAVQLTPKENFMRMIDGKTPQSVPVLTMGSSLPDLPTPPILSVGPLMGMMADMMDAMAAGKPLPDRVTNEWGVIMVCNKECTGGMLPEPVKFMLKDIHDWKKIIKAPPPLETSDSWWADKAKKDIEFSRIDRTQTLASAGISYSPFTHLINFMGFNEGLCALFEDPEEVKELLNWQCDYYMPITEKVIKYYQPDFVTLFDDTATRRNPFFSVEMYRDIFKPLYRRLTKPFVDKGIWVEFHNCGRCEDFVPDMCDFGVRAWDPAQTDNDLVNLKKKNAISALGGWDFVPPADGNITEEIVRQQARDTLNKYAPGGRYAFFGNIMTETGDPNGNKYNGWAFSEIFALAANYYEK